MVPASKKPPVTMGMEILGNAPATDYITFHYTDSTGSSQHSQSIYTGPNFSSAWHTFGVDWEPSAITWYVDGVARKTFTTAGRRTALSVP